MAYDALEAKNFPHAFSLINESIEQGLSTDDLKANALNMRATFMFVIGNAAKALEDLDESTRLKPDYVQSWVKKASVHMELSQREEAFKDFDRAIEADPSDPDIYYHRGQVHFILQEFDEALKDYTKSTELDDSFIFSQVQYAVAQYKLGKLPQSKRSFDRILSKFKESSEAYNYCGELQLDQQEYEAALEKFDKAIAIESAKKNSSNVLPMINKALLLFQWRSDLRGAEELCRQALDIDPDCDVAVATLAQLSLQQGRIPEAIDYFERSAQIARTEPELINAITYEHVSSLVRSILYANCLLTYFFSTPFRRPEPKRNSSNASPNKVPTSRPSLAPCLDTSMTTMLVSHVSHTLAPPLLAPISGGFCACPVTSS